MAHRSWRHPLISGLVVVAAVASGCSSADHDSLEMRSGQASSSAATTAPPTTPVDEPTTQSAPPRKRFHRIDGQPYRFENSFRGMNYALANDYAWIDIDSNYCLDDTRTRRVPIATHWSRIDTEGFDPARRYPPSTRWTDLTFSQVRALRTRDDPPYALHRMVTMVRYAARIGLEGIEWEVKTGVGFERTATYVDVLRVAKEAGVKIEVKTIYGLGGADASLARLRAAKRAGATTMLINPTSTPLVITPAQERYVDFVRGKWQRA